MEVAQALIGALARQPADFDRQVVREPHGGERSLPGTLGVLDAHEEGLSLVVGALG